MRYRNVFLSIGFSMAAVVGAAERGAEVVRVLYLQDADVHEAMTLLRSELAVRSIAAVGDLNALVVSDHPDQVDLSEKLLAEQNVLARTAEPHGPVHSPAPDERALETRVIGLSGKVAPPTLLTVLRSIYRVRQLEVSPDDDSVSVTAPVEQLDQIEAMLTELQAVD